MKGLRLLLQPLKRGPGGERGSHAQRTVYPFFGVAESASKASLGVVRRSSGGPKAWRGQPKGPGEPKLQTAAEAAVEMAKQAWQGVLTGSILPKSRWGSEPRWYTLNASRQLSNSTLITREDELLHPYCLTCPS